MFKITNTIPYVLKNVIQFILYSLHALLYLIIRLTDHNNYVESKLKIGCFLLFRTILK